MEELHPIDENYEDHSHSFHPWGLKVWSSYYFDGFGWFRIFGKGLKWKDTTRYMLFFSERHGFAKALNLGKWRIGFLKNKGI